MRSRPRRSVVLKRPDAAHTRSRANSYDNAWQSDWIDMVQLTLSTDVGITKTPGKVIHVGDSMTFSAAYGAWAQTPNGAAADDTTALNWMHANAGAVNSNGYRLSANGTTAGSGWDWYRPEIETILTDPTTNDAQFAVMMFNIASLTPTNLGPIPGYVDDYLAAGIVPILCAIPPRDAAGFNDNYAIPYNAALKALAQTKQVPFIDTYTEFLMRRPGTTWLGTLINSSDGTHPTGSENVSVTSDPYAGGGSAVTHTTGSACLDSGYLLRTWLTTQKLWQIKTLAVDTMTSGRSLLTLADMTWQGGYQFPATGNAAVPGPGTTTYSGGALAVRYVGGERRVLIPLFRVNDGTGKQWGDLVEYKAPVTAPSTGADPSLFPSLIETRRWALWTCFESGWTNRDADSGNRLGGIYWDESTGYLWYQIYGYYFGRNAPLLGATQLTDTVDTGNYRVVGTKKGPWWYRSNDSTDTTNLYWKSVNYWMFPIPASAQSDLQGKTFMIGGSPGAVGGAGNLGPGITAIDSLPSLSDAPNSIIPNGLHLADYTDGTGLAKPNARRDSDYNLIEYTDHMSSDTGLKQPVGGLGYWLMSLDQVNGCAWIETATKHGIVMFGRKASGNVAYSHSPSTTTPRSCSITRSGTTATCTMFNHNFLTGASVTIKNAYPNEYNGTFTITVIDDHTFTYTMSGTPGASPASANRTITSISTAVPPVVTTPFPHGWTTGTDVLFSSVSGVLPNINYSASSKAFDINVLSSTTFSIQEPPRSVFSVSAANPAVVTMYDSHGYTTGDTVILAGVTGSTPNVNGTAYTITVTSPSTFTIPVSVTVAGANGTAAKQVVLTNAGTGGTANNGLGFWGEGWDERVYPIIVDPTRPTGTGNGYSASVWKGAVYLLDPAEVRQVGLGTRSGNNTGINPADIGDWQVQWPNLPRNHDDPEGGATDSRPITSFISNTHFWDTVAQQFLWVQPMSISRADNRPTLNIFTIS